MFSGFKLVIRFMKLRCPIERQLDKLCAARRMGNKTPRDPWSNTANPVRSVEGKKKRLLRSYYKTYTFSLLPSLRGDKLILDF